MEIGYCFDDKEMFINREGKDVAKNNHVGHNTYIFGAPEWYCTPIKNVLTKLHAKYPISNIEITFFKLAIDLGELDKFIRYKDVNIVKNIDASSEMNERPKCNEANKKDSQLELFK